MKKPPSAAGSAALGSVSFRLLLRFHVAAGPCRWEPGSPLAYCAAVDGQGDGGGDRFRDPEGVPHARRSQKPAEEEGCGDHEDDVAEQGDHQGGKALAQALQGAGGGDGYGGYHEPGADDPQGGFPRLDGLGVFGEQPGEPAGKGQEQDGAQGHDAAGHGQHQPVDLPHPAVLPGAEVVADEGAHALDDAVGGQVEKGLELVVSAQDQDIHLGVGGENGVEGGDEEGGQGEVQHRRDADGVQAQAHALLPGRGPMTRRPLKRRINCTE